MKSARRDDFEEVTQPDVLLDIHNVLGTIDEEERQYEQRRREQEQSVAAGSGTRR